tara:strand:+ start:4186 stop:5328 length:1143 start_codon:yes stop_codon:yes gene_type:complete
MKSFEQLVKEYYEPAPKKDVSSLLFEMVEGELSEVFVRDTGVELQKALDIVEREGYHYDLPRYNVIRIRSPERVNVMDKMTQMLAPLGYEHRDDGSTLGRLQRIDRQEGSVYILFKPPFGERAADVGAHEEEKFVKMAQEIAGKAISAESAGSGHGSDLTLSGPNGELTIEVKTGISADFGQFRLRYDTGEGRWEPSTTSKFLENMKVFMPIYENYVDDYVQKSYVMSEPYDERFQMRNLMSADRENVVGQVITGLKRSPTTGEFKRQLEAEWFGGKTDKKIEFPFEMISNYYADKGDRFIQLGNWGLYALNAADAKEFGIPLFSESGLQSLVRLRLKPSMGTNSATSFNVAIKIKGRLEKSPLNLRNREDLEKIISKIM